MNGQDEKVVLMNESIEIFFSYAHKDEPLREELEKQLSLLQWQGLITGWHDRRIVAGQEWADEIDTHLNTASIILLLISPDFMASKYCYGVEVKRAMERHERGEARVIPIILRPVYWQGAPFGKLQALPTDAIPVTSSKRHDLDEAFFNVAEGIRKVAEALLLKEKKKKEEYLLLKQMFEKAYFADDDEAILAAYDDIQYSSHRESFVFSSSDLQRVSLASYRRQIGQQRQALPQNIKPVQPKSGLQLRLIAADKTDVGKQREQNEDAPYKRIESSPDGDLGLFIVAAGISGYQAGEVASRLAVQTISKNLDSFFNPLSESTISDVEDSFLYAPARWDRGERSQSTISDVEDSLDAVVQQANKAIFRYGEQQNVARGLGCTVTAVLVDNDRAYIANVGDCRTYLLRGNKLTQLTKDHSLAARLVESKQIEPDDVYTHPQRHAFYRSLGAGHKNIEVDIFYETLRPGDTLLLCSDGLWEMVRDSDLLKTLSEEKKTPKICDKLIELANANGGEDDITAVVVQVSAY